MLDKKSMIAYLEIIRKLIYTLDCYDGGEPLISNQGQSLDGYSALANFVELAREAKALEV